MTQFNYSLPPSQSLSCTSVCVCVILGDCPFNYVPTPWAGITLSKAMDGFCHVLSNPTHVKKSPELLVTISDILAGTGWSSYPRLLGCCLHQPEVVLIVVEVRASLSPLALTDSLGTYTGWSS